jgi:hypothetical protein
VRFSYNINVEREKTPKDIEDTGHENKGCVYTGENIYSLFISVFTLCI